MKQREIKFREFCDTDDGEEMLYFKTGMFDNGLWFESLKHIGDYVSPLMQFTGLLDKNGREIYEGDVIKWIHKHGDFEPTEQVSTVEYQKYSDGWIGYEVFNDAEIIGNLYENPELLK